MKNYFTIGLMALTLAFGVTSCDKQDNGGAAVNALSLEAQGLASKVTFSETGGMAAPKGFKNLTGKNAGEFTHIYSTTDQVLEITNVAGESVYTGNYTPNDITNIDPASIILANGDGYTATSSNESNFSDELVLGYLPYTSTIGFDLSVSGAISLEATLLRGFLIVDVENALENVRVESATVQIGEGDVVALNGPDDQGDYWGYLADATYKVQVNYLRDDVSTPVKGTQRVINGLAYTIELDLPANIVDVIGETVSTTIELGTEAALALNVDRTDGGDINTDGDTLDTLERIVTSTQATLNDEDNGEPVITNGAWSIVLDNSAVSPSETLSPTIDDGSVVNGVDTFSAWSAWSPENNADTSVEEIIQTRTRTIVAVDALDVPAPAGDLSETQTVDNPLYVAPVVANAADEFSYSAFVGEGNVPASRVVSGTAGSVDEVVGNEVEFFTRTITTPRENVVDAYSYVQTRTVSIVINDAQDDPALDLADAEALTQTINVAESRTDAADHVATEEVLNPNYNQPVDATNPSGIVNITGLSVVGASLTTISVVAPDDASASVDGLAITFEGAGQYTVSFSGNPLSADFSITFTVSGDAIGSTFTLPASSESDVAFGN